MTHCLFRPLLALVLGTAAGGAAADTFEITRADDPAPDGCLPGDCSLREAVEATVATPEADTIVLGAGQYQLTRGELAIAGAIVIIGAGSADTRLVASGAEPLLHVVPFGELSLSGIEIGNPDADAIDVEDNAFAHLDDVSVPAGGGVVATVSPGGDEGSGSLLIEHSSLGDALGCLQPEGSCRVFDSRLHEVLVKDSAIELARVDVDGRDTSYWGISIDSHAAVAISDSTIQRQATPLRLYGDGDTAPTVTIRRTRFLDNTGPLGGNRSSIVDIEDVEFRRHVVSDDQIDLPAVLLAQAGPAWFVSRALVAANRGGNTLDGAAVRVLGGGRVVFDNSTFDDNTFRSDLGAGFGHTIGLYNANGQPTILWLLHTTLQRSLLLDDTTQGSLLTVRGAPADVRVANSVLRGTCAFGGGGAITVGVGNAESIGHTCGLDPADNQIDIGASDLWLGALGDHGGFTETMLPQRYSPLLDAAEPAYCALFGALDQRGYARPAGGVGCDIGASEADAVADAIFADGFGD